MANVTFNSTGFPYGVQMTGAMVSTLFDYAYESNSSTSIRFYEGSDYANFGGSFRFSGGGDIVGGTLTSLTVREAGLTIMTVQGWSLSAVQADTLGRTGQWNALRDFMVSGNDVVIGTNYNDILVSGAGNDVVYGLSGRDVLLGGTGNDQLNGGLGSDNLQAGAGSDSFVFTTTLSSTTNVDRMPDFNHIADTIKLDDRVFAGIGALGALGAARFHTGTAAHDASDRVIYNQATGQVFYDRDGTGAAAKVLFATVTAGTLIDHTDFLVF